MPPRSSHATHELGDEPCIRCTLRYTAIRSCGASPPSPASAAAAADATALPRFAFAFAVGFRELPASDRVGAPAESGSTCGGVIEETPAGRFAGDDDRGVAGLAGRLAAGGIFAQFAGAAAVRRSMRPKSVWKLAALLAAQLKHAHVTPRSTVDVKPC